MKEKRCYTVNDLEEILEVSKPAVYELLKQKKFHWVMVGGRYKIPRKSFDAWLEGDAEGQE